MEDFARVTLYKELNVLWRSEQEKLFLVSVRFDVDKENES